MRQPTAEECSTNAVITDPDDTNDGTAIWWPQMGGYHARAIAVTDPDGHLDIHVWHDGDFPFDGRCQNCRNPREAVIVHICDPEQFTQFGQTLARIASAT